jgi:hypothetical protein
MHRHTLEDIAKTVLPTTLFEHVQAVRSRRHQVRLLEEWGLLSAARQFVQRHGTVVQHGPFKGMIYPLDAALSRHSIPKLMGTYERELHGIIALVSSRSYDLIIDIGSAEGYYAIGLAKLLQTKVMAYDPARLENSCCREMARLNGVSELVQLNSLFSSSDLDHFADKRVFVLCDCEGFESQLFDENTISKTAKWDLLVELHGVAARSFPEFRWPQSTSLITAEPRRETYTELRDLGRSEDLLNEYRIDQQTWLWCDSQSRSLACTSGLG